MCFGWRFTWCFCGCEWPVSPDMQSQYFTPGRVDERIWPHTHTHTHTHRERERERVRLREREREFLSVTFTGLINALGAFLTLFTACLSLKHIPSHQTSVTKYIIRSIRQNTFSARNHAHHYCIRKKAKKGQWHFAEVSSSPDGSLYFIFFIFQSYFMN